MAMVVNHDPKCRNNQNHRDDRNIADYSYRPKWPGAKQEDRTQSKWRDQWTHCSAPLDEQATDFLQTTQYIAKRHLPDSISRDDPKSTHESTGTFGSPR